MFLLFASGFLCFLYSYSCQASFPLVSNWENGIMFIRLYEMTFSTTV